MSGVFYKTSTEGWRVGIAEGFPNTSTVAVVDATSKLKETVRAEDVYMPTAENEGLLHMETDKQYLAKDDAIAMKPSPIELPPLIHCMRLRHAEGKNLLFLGDNVAVTLGPDTDGEERLAKRVVTAYDATGQKQTIVAHGDRSMLQAATISSATCRWLGAAEDDIERIGAAHIVMATFTHTIDGKQKALRKLDICCEEGQYKYAQLQYGLFDYDAVDTCRDNNFTAIGFLIYAFNSEEKERCAIPKRHTDFAAQAKIEDVDVIAQLRDKYFRFTKAMETLGFEIEVQLTVFARVAAVLHLLDITFSPDGECTNLNAMKNAARLIQADFNALQKALTSKEVCITVAKLLYLSVFKYLCIRVNNVLNPDGLSADTVVQVLGIPQVETSDVNPIPIKKVVLHTLVEDLHQCFFRSSEQEMVQWQTQGFAVSDELQAVFDSADNYSLLKVLKGKGGVIASSLSRDLPAMYEQLNKVSRHSKCNFDPSTGILTVKHSFGTVRYQMPVDEPAMHGLDTVHHDRFAELRDFLVGNTDVDTQEALCLVEQADDREDHHVAHDWKEVQPVMNIVCSEMEQSMHWWLKVVDTTTGFNGQVLAEKLTDLMVHPVVELRTLLPHRYIGCDPQYISKTFSSLVPKDDQGKNDREKAEIICKEAGVHHCLGKSSLLIEASGIITLEEYVCSVRDKAAALLQAAAKSIVAAKSVNERVASWTRAVNAYESEQDDAKRLHKWQVDNALRHRDEQLELLEQQNEARIAIRDECWVAWVQLQTEVQQNLENIIQQNVARSIQEESRLIKSSIDHSHKAALAEISSRIQERLLMQGAHLDAVVDLQAKNEESSNQRMQRLERVNNKVLKSRVVQEEARMELENKLLNKQNRHKYIAMDREAKRERLRQEMWMKQERDRANRVRMDKTRDVISNRMRENIVMDDIERTLAKRLQQEVVERQRREKEQKEAEMREKRKAREQQLMQQQKLHARAMIKREAALERQKEEDEKVKRRQQQAIWASQERERRAAERLQKEEEKRQKVLTRSLLRAHNVLNSPAVYEQSLRGSSVLSQKSNGSKRVDPASSSGFVMANDKTTYPRLLNTETWDGIIGYHRSRREGTLESAFQASQHRERSASPRSVFSL